MWTGPIKYKVNIESDLREKKNCFNCYLIDGDVFILLLQGKNHGIVALDKDFKMILNLLPIENQSVHVDYWSLVPQTDEAGCTEFLLTTRFRGEDIDELQ